MGCAQSNHGIMAGSNKLIKKGILTPLMMANKSALFGIEVE
tara:strand:+ start:119 stop:241 length:123 start_codon:yes stop_codon:yes gene_type:complete